MIKIQIPEINNLKIEYLNLIKPLVIVDLKKLRLSLEHLENYKTINTDDIVSVKTITKEIVNIIRQPSLPSKKFNKPVYKAGVKKHLAGAKIVYPVNIPGLLKLLDSFLELSNDKLEFLLTCEPDKLKETTDKLLSTYCLRNKEELDILKYGFIYQHGDAGKAARRFFRAKRLTTFCPYCNQGLAIYTENAQTGEIADHFHLDHFFDKDNNPLLALSLFNLVPSETTCNVTNKSTKPFSDKFHLNPYISGFKQTMKFNPICDPLNKEIKEIKLNITVPRNSSRHLQLIGDKDNLHEKPEHGNLNVFQIYTKYNRNDVLEKSSHILRNIHNTAVNKESLNDLLNDMALTNSYENFKNWYEKSVYTRFHEKEFDKQPYSKLNRDILDFVYKTYPYDFNKEVRKILEDSYLPEKGGE